MIRDGALQYLPPGGVRNEIVRQMQLALFPAEQTEPAVSVTMFPR